MGTHSHLSSTYWLMNARCESGHMSQLCVIKGFVRMRACHDGSRKESREQRHMQPETGRSCSIIRIIRTISANCMALKLVCARFLSQEYLCMISCAAEENVVER